MGTVHTHAQQISKIEEKLITSLHGYGNGLVRNYYVCMLIRHYDIPYKDKCHVKSKEYSIPKV